MMLGAHLAGVSLASVAMGLHHGLCHVLGGTAGVPHGIANSIVLPHVMRFNADAVGRELVQVAEAMGIQREGHDAIAMVERAGQRVQEWAAQAQLPQHLRDTGVREEDLPRLAELAAQSRTIRNNPKPIAEAQLAALLREMW
jgi:lactaldehyde reductase